MLVRHTQQTVRLHDLQPLLCNSSFVVVFQAVIGDCFQGKVATVSLAIQPHTHYVDNTSLVQLVTNVNHNI